MALPGGCFQLKAPVSLSCTFNESFWSFGSSITKSIEASSHLGQRPGMHLACFQGPKSMLKAAEHIIHHPELSIKDLLGVRGMELRLY